MRATVRRRKSPSSQTEQRRRQAVVSHASARFVEESCFTLQHGLERWLVGACMEAPSRSKPWHTGKPALLNLLLDSIPARR